MTFGTALVFKQSGLQRFVSPLFIPPFTYLCNILLSSDHLSFFPFLHNFFPSNFPSILLPFISFIPSSFCSIPSFLHTIFISFLLSFIPYFFPSLISTFLLPITTSFFFYSFLLSNIPSFTPSFFLASSYSSFLPQYQQIPYIHSYTCSLILILVNFIFNHPFAVNLFLHLLI